MGAIPIHWTPGSKFGYSGEAYSYLQSVITHLTGHVDNGRCGEFESGVRFCATDIADFMRKRLLPPFQMDSSNYIWSEQLAKNLARPHGEHGEPQAFHKPAALDASGYAAAGGLITTPTDYAKFLIELIQPSPADEFHVSKKSHGEMIRPQFPFQDFDGYSVSWGLLGCRMVRTSQHQLITPGGSNPGFHGQPRPSDSPPLCYHLRIMDKHAFKTDKEGHIVYEDSYRLFKRCNQQHSCAPCC
jgi:hypothetical protein